MAEEPDGVTVATFALPGNLMTTLLKMKVLSPEDVREVLDATLSKFETSSFDIESFVCSESP
jgi:lantibiotic modifying enzyme